MRFYIPPQDLDTAMTRLADQAGIRLLGASGDLAGKRTAGLSGSYTIAQALNTLLAGSGVGWRLSEANTVILERLAPGSSAPGVVPLDPVRVQGGVPPQALIDNLPPPYSGGQVAKGAQVGFLGERDFMDTPFNQSSYTSTLMQNQQARSIADVAANDPSVRNAWPAVGYSTALMIRGFSFNSNDMSFGGLYGIAPTLLVAPDYLERVEILKGPSAMLNGMPPFGSVGGAVNLVPKRAQGELRHGRPVRRHHRRRPPVRRRRGMGSPLQWHLSQRQHAGRSPDPGGGRRSVRSRLSRRPPARCSRLRLPDPGHQLALARHVCRGGVAGAAGAGRHG